MALIAEELVEEWLNQQKYFTIRNLKSGQNEIDLLGVKLNGKSKNQLVHVEVMVSHSPMSWICRINLKGAGGRSQEEIKSEVDAWVEKKYTSETKQLMRHKLVPHTNTDDWGMMFVHGVLTDKNHEELEYMKELGINIISIKKIMLELQENDGNIFTGGDGREISNLISIYENLE